MILNPLNAYPSWIQWTPDMWDLKFWAVLLKIHSNKYCLAYNCAGAGGVLVVNIFRALLVYEILSVWAKLWIWIWILPKKTAAQQYLTCIAEVISLDFVVLDHGLTGLYKQCWPACLRSVNRFRRCISTYTRPQLWGLHLLLLVNSNVDSLTSPWIAHEEMRPTAYHHHQWRDNQNWDMVLQITGRMILSLTLRNPGYEWSI